MLNFLIILLITLCYNYFFNLSICPTVNSDQKGQMLGMSDFKETDGLSLIQEEETFS